MGNKCKVNVLHFLPFLIKKEREKCAIVKKSIQYLSPLSLRMKPQKRKRKLNNYGRYS